MSVKVPIIHLKTSPEYIRELFLNQVKYLILCEDYHKFRQNKAGNCRLYYLPMNCLKDFPLIPRNRDLYFGESSSRVRASGPVSHTETLNIQGYF